jgi:DHA2 family multidrug resistance protein
MFITAVGMFLTMHFTPQTDYNTFVMLRILQVGGLPFLFVPISTMAFSAIPKEKSGKASALYSLMRNLGGSFGISALLTFLERREQTHQNFMVEHLTPANHGFAPALARATANEVNAGYGHGAAVGVARGLL